MAVIDFGDRVVIGGSTNNLQRVAQELAARLLRNRRTVLRGEVTTMDLIAIDEVSFSVLDAYVRLVDASMGAVPLEWRDTSFEAVPLTINLDPLMPYTTRNDPHPSERPMQTPSGRIGDEIDVAGIHRDNLDARYGLLSNVFRDLSSSGTALVGAEFRWKGTVISAFGRGATFAAAERLALLEGFERMALHGVAGVIGSGPFSSARGDIDPRSLTRYAMRSAADRYEYHDGQDIAWIEGRDHRTRGTRRVPLQAVELGPTDGARFLLETSNGAALGASLSESRLFALLEVIERDAFMVFWGGQVRLNRFDPATLPPDLLEIIQAFDTPHTRVELFDMTADVHVPTALCLVVSDQGPVATYVSTASSIDPHTALHGAIVEALVGHRIYGHNDAIVRGTFAPTDEVVDMFDHVRRAARPEFIDAYDMLLRDNPVVSAAPFLRQVPLTGVTAADTLDALVRLLPEHCDVVFVDLTTELTAKYGLYVSKAVVPDLLPMTFGHRHRRPDRQRLDAALDASGWRGRARTQRGEWYDEPHPFP